MTASLVRMTMGDVIHVDFKRKVRRETTWLDEQERLFSEAMKDSDTPTADEYYNLAPSDCE
jgi:hypothetical protein